MDLQPILENDLLLLRPLQESDFDELYAVASDRLIWEQHPRRDRYKRDVFEALFEDSLKSGGALVVIDKNTSKIIGSSRYYDVNLSKSEIVIGFTFLARAYWGGRYNKELKALMIQYAFKYFDNILFHVDENNHRSRRAMEKIGGHVSSEIVKPERKVLVYRVPKTLIETSRLVFTPLHLDHLDHFYEMERDPEVLKYYRRKVANDIDEAKENLQKYLTYSQKFPGLGAFSVFLKAEKSFVGIGVLIHLDKNPEALDYEIGYRLKRANWGKGYATEIAQALIDYAYRTRGLSRLLATTHPDNISSQKVLFKTGFRLAGEGEFHGGTCKLFKHNR